MGLYGNLSETKQGFRQSESIIFAMSKLMGGMTQLLRNLAQLSSNLAQIARIQGSGIGYSVVRGQGGTPDVSLVSGVGFCAGRGQGRIGQQESTPVGRGQGGINLDRTPDLSLRKGLTLQS